MAEFAHGFKESPGRNNQNTVSETLNFETGDQEQKRTWIGPYDKRKDFIRDELLSSNGFPKEHPEWTNNFVNTVEVTGDAVSGSNDEKVAEFDRAIIKVTYKPLKNNSTSKPQGDRDEKDSYRLQLSVVERSNGSAEYLSVPAVKEDGSGEIDNVNGPFHTLEILGDVSLQHKTLVKPLWFEYNLAYNTTNDTAFITPNGRVFPTDTLLYLGEETSKQKNLTVTFEGVDIDPISFWWDITHSFRFNPNGWNKKFVNGEWKATTRPNGDPWFNKSDFYTIFFGLQAVAAGNTFDPFTLGAIDASYTAITAKYDLNVGPNNPNGLIDPVTNEIDQVILGHITDINQSLQTLGFQV